MWETVARRFSAHSARRLKCSIVNLSALLVEWSHSGFFVFVKHLRSVCEKTKASAKHYYITVESQKKVSGLCVLPEINQVIKEEGFFCLFWGWFFFNFLFLMASNFMCSSGWATYWKFSVQDCTSSLKKVFTTVLFLQDLL